jgi:hypothetical protein
VSVVTAGEDYSGDNTNEQDDTPAQASQEIGAGNSALASFNAANGLGFGHPGSRVVWIGSGTACSPDLPPAGNRGVVVGH